MRCTRQCDVDLNVAECCLKVFRSVLYHRNEPVKTKEFYTDVPATEEVCWMNVLSGQRGKTRESSAGRLNLLPSVASLGGDTIQGGG